MNRGVYCSWQWQPSWSMKCIMLSQWVHRLQDGCHCHGKSNHSICTIEQKWYYRAHPIQSLVFKHWVSHCTGYEGQKVMGKTWCSNSFLAHVQRECFIWTGLGMRLIVTLSCVCVCVCVGGGGGAGKPWTGNRVDPHMSDTGSFSKGEARSPSAVRTWVHSVLWQALISTAAITWTIQMWHCHNIETPHIWMLWTIQTLRRQFREGGGYCAWREKFPTRSIGHSQARISPYASHCALFYSNSAYWWRW
jgi:hypothetical protein